MSSWVENQQQAAFQLYRRYLGISLHFRGDTGYDYTMYNGATRATLASFLKKSKTEVAKFIQLNNRIKGINPEEFLFANARYDHLDIKQLLTAEATNIYEKWKSQYGDHDSYNLSVFNQLNRLNESYPGATLSEEVERLVNRLLGLDDSFVELIAWLLQRNPEIGTAVRVLADENIFKKMMLAKVQRVQKFYSYFCVI